MKQEVEWIAVTDRLPEFPENCTSVTCIVQYENGNVNALDYDVNPYAKTEKGGQPKWLYHWRIEFRVIAYWMYLPKPTHKLAP